MIATIIRVLLFFVLLAACATSCYMTIVYAMIALAQPTAAATALTVWLAFVSLISVAALWVSGNRWLNI